MSKLGNHRFSSLSSDKTKSCIRSRLAVLLRPTLCAVGVAIAVGGFATTAESSAPLTSHPAEHATKADGKRVARVDNTPSPHVPLPCGDNPIAQLQPPPSPPPATLCDGTWCVSLAAVAANIHQQLDCNVMGYAFFVGNSLTLPNGLFGAYGTARTSKNPPSAAFTIDSKMQIASTSKVLTGLAALKVMGTTDIDKPAYTYFPWMTPAGSIVRNISSRQFVSQTSGVMQYDAGSDDDADLQTFFQQPTPNPGAPADCDVPNPPNPILAFTVPCYSNANYAIMRSVLPRYAGSTSTDPTTLANAYVGQVNKYVFNPVGVQNDGCKASVTTAFALGYVFPATQPGTAFNDPTNGDLRLTCGAWGWWVSVKDYASVLVSLNAGDGKILDACGFHDMVTNPPAHPVGWDIVTDYASPSHRWVEKNGGDSWGTQNGAGWVSTSVGIYGGRDACVPKGKFGPAPIKGVAAVLFINSNYLGSDPVGIFNGPIAAPGTLTLSGSLVAGGVATIGGNIHHNVIVSSSKSTDTQKLQITGTSNGSPHVETLTLNGTNAVWSASTFDSVTKVSVSGGTYPSAGKISIGTSGVGADSVLINALHAATTPQ